MGGAFTAQARDASALYYNPGALALLGDEAPKFSGGLTVSALNQSLYQGRPPGIGTGTTAEQEGGEEFLAHAFLAQELGESARLGFGLWSPFRLETRWQAPDRFAGRYATLAASVSTIDLGAGAAVAVGESLGLGAALIYRTSDFEHTKRLASLDPAAGRVVDVASQVIEATQDDGFGYAVGLLHRPSAGFSWGLSYRSAIEIDYSGTGLLTQIETGNEQLDALLAATLPFDEDLAFASRIEFPDLLALGLALHPGERLTIELDLDRVGWAAVDRLAFRFPNNAELDEERFQGFADTESYRLGVSIETHGGTVFRAGASFEESPQPDRAVGALFPDGDRTGYHLGLSRDWLDVAFVWVDVGERLVATSSDGLNGAYNGDAWLLLITVNK